MDGVWSEIKKLDHVWVDDVNQGVFYDGGG